MRNLKKYSNHSGPGGYMLYDAEVEYLESTYSNSGGVFYVDADFVPKDTPRIVVNVCHTSSADSHMFGMPTAQVPYWLGNINRNSNKTSLTFYYRYYNTNYTQFTASSSTNPFVVLDVGYEVKIDGTTVKTFERQDFSANTQHVYLFGNGKYSHSVRIAWCKFYDGDTLIRDLIPVRAGQVGYMYDKISGQLFGNSGSGSFVLGEDVGEGKPADDNLLYKVSICKSENHTHYDKPYDSKIAYIETDGTQYIDTGISFKDVKTFSMSITITPTRLYNYNHILYVGGTNQEAWITTQGYVCYRWNGMGSNTLKVLLQDDNINVRMEFDGINHTCDYYVDGSIASSQSNNAFIPLTITNNLILLKRDTFSELKLYDFKLIQDSNLVLDLIPVRVGQAGYMYDRVSKRLFGNSGTGTFTLGPDI